jgi:hypothetical protein
MIFCFMAPSEMENRWQLDQIDLGVEQTDSPG